MTKPARLRAFGGPFTAGSASASWSCWCRSRFRARCWSGTTPRCAASSRPLRRDGDAARATFGLSGERHRSACGQRAAGCGPVSSGRGLASDRDGARGAAGRGRPNPVRQRLSRSTDRAGARRGGFSFFAHRLAASLPREPDDSRIFRPRHRRLGRRRHADPVADWHLAVVAAQRRVPAGTALAARRRTQRPTFTICSGSGYRSRSRWCRSPASISASRRRCGK